MNIKSKIAAVACAGALAMGGVVPAFAADGVNKDGGTQDVKISASVAKPGEKIISVTLPSQMAIAIQTKADGKFDTYTTVPATVSNHEVSNAAVKVDVAKVSQTAGLDSNGKLLDLVKLSLVGDDKNTVLLAENVADAPLIASMGVKGSYDLQLKAEAADSDPAIPTDAYTVNATLKVTAL